MARMARRELRRKVAAWERGGAGPLDRWMREERRQEEEDEFNRRRQRELEEQERRDEGEVPRPWPRPWNSPDDDSPEDR